MIFRKAQECSGSILVRVSMEDLTKIHDISRHQRTLEGRRASPRRGGNTDNALLAIHSLGHLI